MNDAPKLMPRLSNAQSEAMAISGVNRCMNKSVPFNKGPNPYILDKKRNTVSIVTVTPAVPTIFK